MLQHHSLITIFFKLTVTYQVPLRVKRDFDSLRIQFGIIFLSVFKVIKEEDLVDIRKFLSAAFQDTRDQLEDVESMDQLEKFLLDHTSFTDFPMLEGLACKFKLKAVEKELGSYVEYRSTMYERILAENFDLAGIDECIKDSQTKVGYG